MLIKTKPDEFENYLRDASNLAGGVADEIFFPKTIADVAEILRQANTRKMPVTISGAGTGIVGGRVPFGGAVMALDKLSRIEKIEKNDDCFGVVQSGVILADFQRETERAKLFYPPDPTEWSCQIGGTVATNASGARSFKYGATREFVLELEVVLPTGEIISIKRGEIFAGNDNKICFQTENRRIEFDLPTYKMPNTRKHAAGYFVKPAMDLIDLFIGSEGTLGVVTKIKIKLLNKPESVLSGIVFFQNENDLLNFVAEARKLSFETRESARNALAGARNLIDARLLEYFDRNALDFVREKFPLVPENMDGAIFFEQETNAAEEEVLLSVWFDLLEKHRADTEKSWFAANDADARKMREFRHALPVAVNEHIVKHNQRKVSTDIAVPDCEFAAMLRFYKKTLKDFDLNYVIFGHIGDNHVHVNILPRGGREAERARHAYGRFIARACIVGGTISAEHGIGKIKRRYLEAMFGERFLNEMAAVKKAFDPFGILNRGVMFDEKFLI
jgi:D-lactate dehydrogenase (cytochrome)